MTIQALGTKIIVEQVEQEHTSAAGIVLTNMQNPNPLAQVLSVGADVKIAVQAGDLVIISWSNTARQQYQNKTVYIVDETGVFGRMTND